ncbi:MAG: PspC domain-containing protein [Bacteroidetes bacterium]|nr:PspC domain-containing protein [Bacteroidota bacterium]MDE2672673.1 PspC domain-containing protein [Bacteroidota bacterium]
MTTRSHLSELELSTQSSDALEEMLFESESRSASKINWHLVGGGTLLIGIFLYLLSEIGVLGNGFVDGLGRFTPFVAIFFMGIAAISALRTKRTRRVRTVSSRHLVRPRKKRWLFGVCRGLANRFGIPVGVLRLLFPAVAVAAGGVAPGGLVIVALYVILALAIPSEETNHRGSS